jgi:hypothetical protein
MSDRDRFAVEVILTSWAALAVAVVMILALGSAPPPGVFDAVRLKSTQEESGVPDVAE